VSDIPKRDLLRQLGYAGPYDELELALEEAGLTHGRKQRISLAKREAAREALAARFALVCARGDCLARVQDFLAEDPPRRRALPVSQKLCEVCGGSGVRGAVSAMADACARTGWRRLCVVGGSPMSRKRLKEEVGDRLELRLIDGMKARTQQLAQQDAGWADLTVIWGGTMLQHKVSGMYKGLGCLAVNGRGLEELVEAVSQAARKAERT
jgi:hypothetical protein